VTVDERLLTYGACRVCRAPRDMRRVVTWENATKVITWSIVCTSNEEHDAMGGGPFPLLLRRVPARGFGQR
jgi:hypothetical protein